MASLAGKKSHSHYPQQYGPPYGQDPHTNHSGGGPPAGASYVCYPRHDGSTSHSGNWQSQHSGLPPQHQKLQGSSYASLPNWSQSSSSHGQQMCRQGSSRDNKNESFEPDWSNAVVNYHQTRNPSGGMGGGVGANPGMVLSPSVHARNLSPHRRRDMNQLGHPTWQQHPSNSGPPWQQHNQQQPLQQQPVPSNGYRHGPRQTQRGPPPHMWNNGLHPMSQPQLTHAPLGGTIQWNNGESISQSSPISGRGLHGALSIDVGDGSSSLCQPLSKQENLDQHGLSSITGIRGDIGGVVDGSVGSISMKGERDDGSGKDKGRGSYRCGKCGVPKKGHICPYQPKLKRHPDERPPVMRNASTQVEMDEFLVLRRLNIEIQGFPESYSAEPLDNVGAESFHPSSVSSSPHSSVGIRGHALNNTMVESSVDRSEDPGPGSGRPEDVQIERSSTPLSKPYSVSDGQKDAVSRGGENNIGEM